MKYETPELLAVSAAESLILGGDSGPNDNVTPPDTLLNFGETGLDE